MSTQPSSVPGKVVLITGASAGIGLGLALALVQRPEAYRVHATMRDLSRKGALEQAVSSLPSEVQSRLFIHALDVTHPTQTQEVVEKVISMHQRIDIAFNNAGVCLAGYSETTELDEIRSSFEINFYGVVRMLQAVLPHMRRQKSGHIFTLSSASGVRPTSGLGFYGASKAALSAIHDAEGPLLRQWNIMMTLVEAGIIETNTAHMSERVIMGSRAAYQDESCALVDVEDGYGHVLAVAHTLFKQHVPQENVRVEAFCEQMHELILKGIKGPPRVQTAGQGVRIAKDVWADPSRRFHHEREEEAVEFYLTRNLDALQADQSDDD